MKKLLLLMLLVCFNQIYAQITLIPDEGFEQELIAQNIDSDGAVNGEVLTSDISGILSLNISNNFEINDLIGIEDFVSLNYLDITNTMLYFDNSFNASQELDLSNNVNLETLIMYGGDDSITNDVRSINLSNNPLISEITVPGNWMLNQINLKSEETDVSDLIINIGIYPPFQENNFCIKVTDEAAANTNQGVYSTWSINADNNPYFFSETCTLSVNDFNLKSVSIYPNPTTNLVEISSDVNTISRIELYSISGQKLDAFKGFTSHQASISLQGLDSGIYLLKVFDNQDNTLTKRLIKK